MAQSMPSVPANPVKVRQSVNATDTPRPLGAKRSGPLKGVVRMPGDKSISHRALIFGALATGRTVIHGLLEGEDVLRTAQAVSALGAPATKRDDGAWEVIGRGVGGLIADTDEETATIDFGNSGTGVRLMMGVIAGHGMRVNVTGDASLSRRPMKRVLTPLRRMGLNTEGDGDCLPLTLIGTSELIPIEYELPVPSAQVKSAVLLAGLHAAGETTVVEAEPTRDHTERMLRHFGADIRETPGSDGKKRITIMGEAELQGRSVNVPGDPSSAAFMTAAAVIVPGSDVTIRNVLVNPARVGFYQTLREMGADIEFQNEREESGEPIADIRARASSLKGVNVPAERAPSMIDEYPILAAVSGFAKGETVMDGLAELKVKESDRLAATAAGLSANGVKADVTGDTLIVRGTGSVPGGGTVKTHMDHRIAMAFLTMGLSADEPVRVDDTNMIATSFPEFRELMQELGATFVAAPHDAPQNAERRA